MELLDLVLISTIMTVAALVHGSIGLGLGLLAAPFLLLLNPAFIPAPMILNGFLLVLAMTIRERRAVDVPQVTWAVFGCVIGTGAAVILLLVIPPDAFSVVFASMLIIAVALSLIKWSGRPSRGVVVAAGAVAGLMGTTTSIGGPPLALVFQNSEGERLRTTMSVYFIAAGILALVGLSIVGKFGLPEVKLAAYLLPGTLAGLFISNYTRRHVRPEYVRWAVLILSATAAATILLK